MFLANQPLKILLNNSYSKKFKTTASLILPFYLLIAISLLIFSISNIEFSTIIVLGIAFILMLIYLVAELQKKSRKLIVEFIPIFAMTLIGLSIVTINSTIKFAPAVFAFILFSRAIPTILYVNAKVKQSKGLWFSSSIAYLADLFFIITIVILIVQNLLPGLSLLAMLIIFGRTLIGFSKFNFTHSVTQIGITEFIVGIIFVIINGISFSTF